MRRHREAYDNYASQSGQNGWPSRPYPQIPIQNNEGLGSIRGLSAVIQRAARYDIGYLAVGAQALWATRFGTQNSQSTEDTAAHHELDASSVDMAVPMTPTRSLSSVTHAIGPSIVDEDYIIDEDYQRRLSTSQSPVTLTMATSLTSPSPRVLHPSTSTDVEAVPLYPPRPPDYDRTSVPEHRNRHSAPRS